MARMSYAKELTKIAADCGANAIKWQLFKNDIKEKSLHPEKYPNIELPREWFPELVAYGKELGLEVFASTFDDEALILVSKYCESIKFSYGFNKDHAIKYLAWPIENKPFKNIYISGDLMTNFPNDRTILRLYCIPQYPVPFIIDFTSLFPPFIGFSDHTMGYGQTLQAVRQGALIIEKHFTLDKSDITCPDHNFALRPKQVEYMIKEIKNICVY